MKKIGILGGTFNPPHFGHLIMANEAYHSLGLEEVRFMPNAIAPHKAVNGVTAAQRLKMTELAIEGYPQFRIEDYEITTGGVSYTFNTISHLVEREPDKEFYFIIGGDTVAELNSWHRIHELAQMIQFVDGRPGYDAATDLSGHDDRFSRNASVFDDAAGKSRSPSAIDVFRPEGVEAYIRKEGLYGSEQNASNR